MFSRYSLVGAMAGAFGGLAAATPDLSGPDRHGPAYGHQGDVRALRAPGRRRRLDLFAHPDTASGNKRQKTAALGPSRHIVYKLAALFSLDAFAGGFVVQSLLALWLFERFELPLSSAGVFFFWSGVLSAFSFPVAAWLSRHIGLVNTMVFTHIPSSVCLIWLRFRRRCPWRWRCC